MKYIAYLLTYCMIVVCHAQTSKNTDLITIGKVVSFEQSNAWTKTSSRLDKSKGLEIANFQREAVRLSSNINCIPTESCLIETVKTVTIQQYSTSSLSVFQKQQDFKILKIITHTDGLLTIPYAIGYWATYTDAQKVKHKVIIIHALQNGKGLQFFIDCPEEGFSVLEEEITAIIRSLRFS